MKDKKQTTKFYTYYDFNYVKKLEREALKY